MAHRKSGGINVVDTRFLPQLRKQECHQGWKSPLLQGNEALIARHPRKITSEHFTHRTVVKVLPVFEPRTVQHKQQGDDLSLGKSRIRPTRPLTVPDHMPLNLVLKSLEKIIHSPEILNEPIPH